MMAMDEDELDLDSVKKSLSQLNKELEDSRSRVLRAVQSKSSEVSLATSQVNDLQGIVDRLDIDLRNFDWLAPSVVHDVRPSPILAFIPSNVQEAAESHAKTEAELKALNSSMEVLKILLRTEELFQQLEGISSSENFVAAAEILGQISVLLQKISAKKGAEATEPDLLWAAKDRYRQQRRSLLQSVEKAFARDLHFAEGLVEVHPTVPQLWRCLDLLGLQRRQVQKTAEVMFQQLQCILAAKANRLMAEEDCDGLGVARFRWLDEKPKDTASKLQVIEGFVNFLCRYVTGDEVEAYKALGYSLYPRMVKVLLSHLDFAQQGPEIEDFERRLQQRGFIAENETSLSRMVQRQREAQYQRPQLLVQARRWILEEVEDAVTVQLSKKTIQVSSAADKLARCLDQLHGSCEEQDLQMLSGRLCWLFAILRPYAQSGGLKNHPRRCCLFVTDVMFLIHKLLQLPEDCRPVQQMEGLKQKCQAELRAMLKCQEETLLASLKPCLLVPDDKATNRTASFVEAETALGSAAGELKATCAAFSTLPRMLLQEVTFHLLGIFCQELLQKLLHHDEQGPGMDGPRMFQEFPAAMGARMVGVGNRLLETALSQTRHVVNPSGSDDLREVLAGLKGSPRSTEDIPTTASPSPATLSADDISSAVTLLTSGQCMVRQTLQAAGLPLDQKLHDKVPGYKKLQLITDLLGSDFQRFRERSKELRKVMTKEEIVRLMNLSFHDEALPAENAWRRLNE